MTAPRSSSLDHSGGPDLSQLLESGQLHADARPPLEAIELRGARIRRRNLRQGAAAGLLAAALAAGLAVWLPSGVSPPTRRAAPSGTAYEGGLSVLGRQRAVTVGVAGERPVAGCAAGAPGCGVPASSSAYAALRSVALPAPPVAGARLTALLYPATSAPYRLEAAGWTPVEAGTCFAGPRLVVALRAAGESGGPPSELVVPSGRGSGRAIETVATGSLRSGPAAVALVVLRVGNGVAKARATFRLGRGGTIARGGRPSSGWVVLALPGSAGARGPVTVSVFRWDGQVLGRVTVPAIGLLEGKALPCVAGG